jgi:hypothetical protein
MMIRDISKYPRELRNFAEAPLTLIIPKIYEAIEKQIIAMKAYTIHIIDFGFWSGSTT